MNIVFCLKLDNSKVTFTLDIFFKLLKYISFLQCLKGFSFVLNYIFLSLREVLEKAKKIHELNTIKNFIWYSTISQDFLNISQMI